MKNIHDLPADSYTSALRINLTRQRPDLLYMNYFCVGKMGYNLKTKSDLNKYIVIFSCRECRICKISIPRRKALKQSSASRETKESVTSVGRFFVHVHAKNDISAF